MKKIARQVEGWISEKEGELLLDLAKNCRGNGYIVEIGSWKGKSTIYLGMGSKIGNKLKIYAIDPHIGTVTQNKFSGKKSSFRDFIQNLEHTELLNLIIPIVKTSEDAAKGWTGESIELLWIDGAHDYKLVNLDYELWEPYLMEGGIIAFHDSELAGPKKVIEKSLYKGNKFTQIGKVGEITFAIKSKDFTRKDFLSNHYRYFLTYIDKFKIFHELFVEFVARSTLPDLLKRIITNFLVLRAILNRIWKILITLTVQDKLKNVI